MIRKCVAATAIFLALAQSMAQAATVLDLTTGPNVSISATSASGATFTVASMQMQPAGTGNFDPFLRVQANTTEQGYNTDAQTPPYDAKAGIWTHTIQLSDIPIVNGNYEFLLDINQNGGQNAPISLNQVQIFQSHADPGATGSTVTAPDANNAASISFSSSDLTQVFKLSSTGSTLWDVQAVTQNGSGVADMFLYVPTSVFSAANGPFVTFYTQFGVPSGTATSNDGFEEWGLGTAQAVAPEPSTIVGASFAALFGLVYAWRRRKS